MKDIHREYNMFSNGMVPLIESIYSPYHLRFSSNSDLFSAPQVDPIFASGRRQHTCDAFITADEVVHELVLPHHHGLRVVNPDARPDGRGGPCSGSGKKDDTGGTPPGEGSGEPTTRGCLLPGVSP